VAKLMSLTLGGWPAAAARFTNHTGAVSVPVSGYANPAPGTGSVTPRCRDAGQ
jgi:hypothetical protein